jgi:hypothetical protein
VAVLVLAAAAIGTYLLRSKPAGGPLAAIPVAAAWPGHHECGASSVPPAGYLG